MHGTSPAEVSVPQSSWGGLVTLALPETVPDNASPRTYNTDYEVGSVKRRDGLTSLYGQTTETTGTNVCGSGTSDTWLSPEAVESSLSYASFQPASDPNSITCAEFSYALSSGSVNGLIFAVRGFSTAPATLQAQLMIAGVPVGIPKTLAMPSAAAVMTFGSSIDTWGVPVTLANVNAVNTGVIFTLIQDGGFNLAQGFLQDCTMAVGLNTGANSTQPLTTFTDQDGHRYNLVLDSAGNLFVEDLDVSPGTLALSQAGITPGSMMSQVMGEGVSYLASVRPLSLGGSYMPMQWSPQWTDRITQVGPGAAPVFTATSASDATFDITSITQPAAMNWTFAFGLQSAGPGSSTPGNVVTIYYADSTITGDDADLVAAFNSGFPVYLYQVLTDSPGMVTPLVVQVTSVGIGPAPDPVLGPTRPFYYYTYNVPTIQYLFGSGHGGFGVNYQRSLATLTTATPIPNATIGSEITIAGVSPSTWDGVWTITETPNASEMVITGSQVTGGVATFNYAVTNLTANPAVGELVTITNTLNAGGQLNVTQYPIATVSGGSTGSFTVAGLAGIPDTPFFAENGLADTAGTIFNFDPGAADVGTGTDPIFGTGTGGTVIFNSTGVFIDPGTYQGTVFFGTRNNYFTKPAPPVVFTVPENCTGIVVTNLPIGPPNVVMRGIAITEAGQNGIPGQNFFTLPEPVTFYNQGIQLTATSFYVADNSSISATLFFTSPILNNGLAIDVYGYNLFNQIEIGDCSVIQQYDLRNWYGQCLNKIQNFLNLSFDGGFSPNATAAPLGWSQPDIYGSLNISPIFGDAYYINNTSGGTLSIAGLIQQSAYQDYLKQNILNPNTGYSVKVWARSPSGATTGNLVIALQAGSTTLGSFTIPLSSMSTSYTSFTGVLVPELGAIPPTAMIQVYAGGLLAGGDVEIDRIDPFPTAIPILTTTVYGSYAGLPEQVDAVTGEVIFASENQQPVQALTVLYDTLYAAKGWLGTSPGSSLYSLQSSPNLEPADWNEPEVAQHSGGAVGPFAWAGGEQWFVAASRAGLYLYVGGQPGKISQEIQQVWDLINWNSGGCLALDINLKVRRILIGVPMATPNFYLPNAPVNANPTTPNVWLLCNFQGLDSGEDLRNEPQMHTTMFGTLASVDMRRKWSMWYGEMGAYATTVQGPNGEETRFGGVLNSKVYYLDPTASDDGEAIDSLYTTGGAPNLSKRAEMPQLGPNRVQWGYILLSLATGGLMNLRLLGDYLYFPEPSNYNAVSVAGGFTPGLQPTTTTQASLNFISTRTFMEFRQNDTGAAWKLSNALLRGRKAPWSSMLGFK